MSGIICSERNEKTVNQLLYWIWLSRIFPYGSPKTNLLLETFGSPKAIHESDQEMLSGCSFLREQERKAIGHTSLDRAELILADCDKHGIQILSYDMPGYPARLRNIYSSPPVIYVKGDLGDIDDDVAIAVVGTRKASDYGMRLTGNLCYELSKAGVVIVSGCAEGVDTYAHWGALKAGGTTLSVLACGLDVNYPSKNTALKQAIVEKGALVSECPPGETPTRFIFPIRNRLISALSLGVLLTEAPIKSGSLITAEHAMEQGKDLFCVPPHDIYDANFAGVSDYLRDGAKSVLSPKDVIEEYIPLYGHKLNADTAFVTPKRKSKTQRTALKQTNAVSADKAERSVPSQGKPKEWDASLSADHRKLYDVMTDHPILLDEISALSDIPISNAAAIATELELLEYITSYSGKRYAKTTISP